jgi:hypothetical protein
MAIVRFLSQKRKKKIELFFKGVQRIKGIKNGSLEMKHSVFLIMSLMDFFLSQVK